MQGSWTKWAALLVVMLVAGSVAWAEAEAPAAGEWTTVAGLRSTDAPWQEMENILVSAPFNADGEVRMALNMPDAGPMDGVIFMIIPADRATDGSSLLRAFRDGVTLILMGAAPLQDVAGLSGECVAVQTVPTAKAWSMVVQTRP